MQQCSECGKQTNLGEQMQHYWGCVHTSSMGNGQAQVHRDFLAGFARPVKNGTWNTESTP